MIGDATGDDRDVQNVLFMCDSGGEVAEEEPPVLEVIGLYRYVLVYVNVTVIVVVIDLKRETISNNLYE